MALDAEELSDTYMELVDMYYGDTVKQFPDKRYAWATIQHFYYVYYVYQYASSVAYAASIAERISVGEEDATENYVSFLKLGGSASPEVLLDTAGINPLEKETYDKAMAHYKSLVDEYERMVEEQIKKN